MPLPEGKKTGGGTDLVKDKANIGHVEFKVISRRQSDTNLGAQK